MTPPVADAASTAFYLDVDGTLLPIEDDFDAVSVPRTTLELVARLRASSSAATALISGRSIDRLDALFEPFKLPVAGLHGTELRDPNGRWSSSVQPRELDAARTVLTSFARETPGVRLEDKGRALALHYRRNPSAAELALATAQRAVARLQPHFECQTGKMVVEIKTRRADKGRALATLAACSPFAGRRPVYVGDDATDEPAFDAVNAQGGISVRVGELHTSTRADYTLPNIRAVHTWLGQCSESSP